MAKHDFRPLIIKYAKQLASDKMTGKGNDYISYKIDENSMYITKKGTDFSKITEAYIEIVKIERNSSNAEVALHSNIYLERGDTNAIIHSATSTIGAVANVGKTLVAPLDDMSQIVGPTVKTAKDDSVAKVLKAMKGRSACLIKESGSITTGRTLAEAHTGTMVLYKACVCHVYGAVIGGTKTIPMLESMLMHIIYKKKYSAKNQELLYNEERGIVVEKEKVQSTRKMQDGELELRKTIIEVGHNLVKDKLVQGTWGNISLRLDKDHMLVTPSGIDYSILKPEDLPVVNIHTLEWEGPYKPTTERKIHASIYANRDDINAVIHTHPITASAFASVRKDIPLFNDALKNALISEVKVAAYGLPGTKKITVGTVEAMGNNYACLLANHGAFSCGTSMDNAYNTLKTIELSAKEYIIDAASKELGEKSDEEAPNKLYAKLCKK